MWKDMAKFGDMELEWEKPVPSNMPHHPFVMWGKPDKRNGNEFWVGQSKEELLEMYRKETHVPSTN